MAVQTHLDELINYSSQIITALMNSPEVVGLIVDKQAADVTEEDMDRAREQMFDYDYIDETTQEAKAYIMVDVDMVASPTGTIKDIEVYVQIAVSKTYQKLNTRTFKGVRGNRRDNLARQIDLLINGRRDFGIGKLQLTSARTANVPSSFTSKLLTYRSSDFAKNRAATHG